MLLRKAWARRAGSACLAAMAGLLPQATAAQPGLLRNEAYELRVAGDHSLLMKSAGSGTVILRPEFRVLVRWDRPEVRMIGRRLEDRISTDQYGFPVPHWRKSGSAEFTPNPFAAAETRTLTATGSRMEAGAVRWEFQRDGEFEFQAYVRLAGGSADPVVEFRLRAEKAGWYTVIYTGAPEHDPAEVDFVYQPLVWHERRIPASPVVSIEHMATTPAVWVSRGGETTAVTVDPGEAPFRMPVFEASRFGFLLRNERGRLQPMYLAPVLGLPESRLEAGGSFSSRFRVVHRAGGWFDTYKHIAREIHRFRDYRENATCSLNETVENMIAFAMDDHYGGWLEEWKGFDYGTEIAGNVKVVSALHPLSVALVTDSREIYRRRGLPVTEYVLSREKFGFSSRAETTDHEGPSHLLRGPAAESGDVAAMFTLFGGRSPVLLDAAKKAFAGPPREMNLRIVSRGDAWPNALALYQASGEDDYLARAKRGADTYIRQRIDRAQDDFADVQIERGGQFWTDYFPKWMSLLDLYEETGEVKYLGAAERGARTFATVIWTTPMPPAGAVTIHPGGKLAWKEGGRKRAPGAGSTATLAAQPPTTEQRVPAWRVAQAGLAPESAVTYEMNSALFLAHHAPYFLRLAHYTGDRFFADLARSAVVGRYASYPGYDINYEFTTVYQRADYLMRPLGSRNYNNVYYNHVWPHIALLVDYLVSDAFDRSGGKVRFPAATALGYAYLQTRVHGARPGRIYGEENVRLWMPPKLLRLDTIQVNYLAGYGNGNLYVVLMNQANEAVTARMEVNADVAPLDKPREYAVDRLDGGGKPEMPGLRDGALPVRLGAKGMAALAVRGLRVEPALQAEAYDSSFPALGRQSFGTTTGEFGKVSGALLSMGRTLTSAYIWLDATEKQLREVELRYEAGGEPAAVKDSRYPFEFTIPLGEAERRISYEVSAVTVKGERVRLGAGELRR